MSKKLKLANFYKRNITTLIIIGVTISVFTLPTVFSKRDNKAQIFPTLPTTEPIALALNNPYQGNQLIERKILNDLDEKNIELKIINLIDNYAYISEHALPPGGGGGWGVVKKNNGKWEYVFLSQEEIYCSLYEKYNLPRWLLGECPI